MPGANFLSGDDRSAKQPLTQAELAQLGTVGGPYQTSPFVRYPRPVGGGVYRVLGNYRTIPVRQLSQRLEFETTSRAFGGLGGLGAEVGALDQIGDRTTTRAPVRPDLVDLNRVFPGTRAFNSLSAEDKEIALRRAAARGQEEALRQLVNLPDVLVDAVGVKPVNEGVARAFGIRGMVRGIPAGGVIDNVIFGTPLGVGEEDQIALMQERERIMRDALNANNGVGIRSLRPDLADPPALPGPDDDDDEQRDDFHGG